MGLSTIFGINGIGKDTVAEEIRKRNPRIRVTSMSRIYMYILGISKTCDVKEEISEEQYKKLERIPQETMKRVENGKYKEILKRMANSEENVIFLGHLVSALRLGSEIEYLIERKTPSWFVDINDNLIQLIAPESIVSERRKGDKGRKRISDIEEILKHQELCTNEWNRIMKENKGCTEKMHIIENIDLKETVDRLESIIYKRNKLKNINIDVFKEYENGR